MLTDDGISTQTHDTFSAHDDHHDDHCDDGRTHDCTDNHRETSWEIREENGSVLISKKFISFCNETTEMCLPEGKHVFNIHDAIGNGFQSCDDFRRADDDAHSKDAMARGRRLTVDHNATKEGAKFDCSGTISFTIVAPSISISEAPKKKKKSKNKKKRRIE